MPFIRVTRDKRGYESTLVMHTYRATSGAQRGRVLYLFRSPSNIHVGRHALEAEVMEALEHTHPDLNFDWNALVREPAARPIEEESRPVRRPPPRSPGAVAPTPTPVVVDDQTLLGRTLGAERAARLRADFAELVQRIARRARSPEERERLMERAARLNPDEWPDEAAIQAGAASFDTARRAIAAELPHRRRGRRGGRHANEGSRPGPVQARPERESGPAAGPSAPSGIMAESGEDDAGAEERGLDREDRESGDRGVDDRLGSDAGPESEDNGADASGEPADGFSGDS